MPSKDNNSIVLVNCIVLHTAGRIYIHVQTHVYVGIYGAVRVVLFVVCSCSRHEHLKPRCCDVIIAFDYYYCTT